jgi:hypothetical protein
MAGSGGIMIRIEGRIITLHRNAGAVASALTPDNLRTMTTTAEGDRVTTVITGTQCRSVIASVDDYLMNLAIAEDATVISAPNNNHQVM